MRVKKRVTIRIDGLGRAIVNARDNAVCDDYDAFIEMNAPEGLEN